MLLTEIATKIGYRFNAVLTDKEKQDHFPKDRGIMKILLLDCFLQWREQEQ